MVLNPPPLVRIPQVDFSYDREEKPFSSSVVEGDVVELVDRREEICACCMVKAGSWRMRSRQDLQKMARHMSTEKAGTRGC